MDRRTRSDSAEAAAANSAKSTVPSVTFTRTECTAAGAARNSGDSMSSW
ncbi:hypothetical protein ABWL35_14255 [Streptomyces cinereoruber]|nr:hypothetical protein [Streptomyces cinereoruber]MBB4158765.1 hypothetical protein [Streptomyces cinereoruber]MBY8816502.1 hypothetical protein [Streptomyces cinereoruber]NIH65303.1 hypothetical protein [Streptomyces cinereoruber]